MNLIFTNHLIDVGVSVLKKKAEILNKIVGLGHNQILIVICISQKRHVAQPVKMYLNKKLLPKQKTTQLFKSNTLEFRIAKYMIKSSHADLFFNFGGFPYRKSNPR